MIWQSKQFLKPSFPMSHLHPITKGTDCNHITYKTHLMFYSNSLASVSYKVNWLTFMCCHHSMTSTGFSSSSDLFYTPSEGMLAHLHKLTNLCAVSIRDAHEALTLGAGKILPTSFSVLCCVRSHCSGNQMLGL